MKTHKDLDIWKISMDFVTSIYRTTSSFPESERFGLSSQMRRAAISIPSNIAEGAGRASNKEFSNFLSISMGSLSEVETQLIIAQNLGYISEKECSDHIEMILQLLKMISSLRSKLIGGGRNP